MTGFSQLPRTRRVTLRMCQRISWVNSIMLWRWLVADERRMSESIPGYPQWEPEMGISATPALPASLASGWEEHHKSIPRCQPSSPPRCSHSLCRPSVGGITWHPSISYCRLTKALPHPPHICHGSGDALQRLGKLKARDHVALAKLNEQPDVKLAIFRCLSLCFNHKPTIFTPEVFSCEMHHHRPPGAEQRVNGSHCI